MTVRRVSIEDVALLIMDQGGLCGSVFVDAAFERYVKTVVGEKEYEAIRPRARKRMMKEFENSVKRCYTGDDKEFSVDLPGVQDNPEEGIDDDTIKLKPYVTGS